MLIVLVVLVQAVPRVKGASWSELGDNLQNEVKRVFSVVIKSEEPIAEPIASIQNQSNQLVEAIQRLPEDQLKAVKKQLYKEFCENLLRDPGN